jgi:branched-chain amino acid transport system substrate-binding protein
VCGDSGYCEDAVFPDRCGTTDLPADLDVVANPGAYDGGIVLASLHDHNYDTAELQSVRLAFIEAVQNGGIDGMPIGLVECSYGVDASLDDLDEDGAAASLGEFLTGRLGIQGYVGPYTSGQSTALFNAIDADDAFILSPSATSPALTTIDGVEKTDAAPGTFWRTAPPDSLQGQVAAEDMIARGRTKVAVVYFNDSYGTGLAEVFAARFSAEAGHDVVRLQFETSSELGAHVATIKADPSIEEVFMISGSSDDIATFLNQAATLTGVGAFEDDPDDPYPATGRGIFLSDAAKDTDMLAAVDAGQVLLDQVRGTAPSAPENSLYDTFKAAYLAEYGTDPNATIYMPYSYDAGWLAIYAATWSVTQQGGLSGVGMGAGMRHVSNGTEIRLLPSDWNTGRARFSEGGGIVVVGTSGPLDYDPATEETATAVDVWRVTDDDAGFEVFEVCPPDAPCEDVE